MSNVDSQNRATAILATLAAQAALVTTVGGKHPTHIVKQTVGLPNVDNTADAVKIVSTPQAAAIAAALASANSHSDANDTTTLGSANSYTDGKIAVLTTLVGDGGAQVLLDAKAYTNLTVQNATTELHTYADAAVAAGVVVAKAYADTQLAAGDAATLTAANNNTTSAVANAISSANTYADGAASAAQTAAQTYADAKDALTLTSANSTSAANALAAQAAAQAFATDAVATSATSVLAASATYTDSGVASAIAAAQAYADAKSAGLLDNRGVFLPVSEGTNYPTDTSGIGGSGAGGSVAKSDFWFVGEEVTVGGVLYTVGDIMFATNDAPGQADANWAGLNTPLSYVPVNIADRATVIDGTNIASETVFPSNKAIVDFGTANYATLETADSMMAALEAQNTIILTLVTQVSALQDALAGI
jgi:hypothetical protein